MKLLFKLLVGLAVLLVLVVVLGVVFIDKVVRLSVEKGGTYALGVETTLEEADFGLFSGQLDLAGLAVANPEGFQHEYFLEMGSASCKVAPASLSSDVIDVPLLALADLTLDIERAANGTNYGAILDHLEQIGSGGKGGSGGGGTGSEEEGEAAEGKLFRIARVSLSNIRVTVSLSTAAGALPPQSLTIPSIELKNVGTAEGGASATDIASELITALLDATIKGGAGTLPADLLQDLTGRLANYESMADAARADLEGRATAIGKDLETKVDETVDTAKDKLEGEKDKLEGEIESKVDKTLDEAKGKLGKGLGGLLGGKKEGDG